MRNHTIFVTVLVLLVFILNSCTTISNKHKIVGKWNADEMLSYVFDKKGYAKIYMGEQVIGGSDLFSGSALKYKIDYSNDPITLDLIHVDKADDKERNRMAMIVKFLSNNKIQIKTFNSTICQS